jgi:hypothetical protein
MIIADTLSKKLALSILAREGIVTEMEFERGGPTG